MTTTDGHLALRTPAWVRTLGAVLVLGWMYPLVHDPPPPGFVLVGGILAVLLTVFVVRASVCQAVATADDRVSVRNVWSTRTFSRDEIDGVVIDRADGSFREGWAVCLVLRDGSRCRLDVTAVPFLGPARDRLERQADAVRAWVAGGPQPYP